MPKTTEHDATLLQLVEPTFLSLVGTPANRTGFKIIRSAKEEGDMAHKDRNIRQRVAKRSDSSLLSIQFPTGVSELEAAELMDVLALGEDYELAHDETGYYARRKETEEGEDVSDGIPIDLGGGFVASIQASSVARSDIVVAGVTVVRMEFDETFSSVDQVKTWLTEREVNFKEGGFEEVTGGYIVTRHDTAEGVDTKKISIADGVTAIVAKTKDTDVPVKIYRSVIEQSYGNWGWGHLNFASALVDPEFTDQSWDAIYVLKDVLENIILYSGLSLEERKALVKGATDQFVQYITALIDSLPRQVLDQAAAASKTSDTAVSRSDTSINPETSMTTEATKPTEDKTAPAAAPATPETGTPEEGQFVTRSELDGMIADAVAKALAATQEPATPEAPATEATPAAADSVQRGDAGNKEVLEVLGKLTESLTVITRSVGDLKTDVDALGGKTHTRSDDDTSQPASVEGVKRGDGSPFTGLFGDRFQ